MAISDTITSMYENVGNVYDVLELAGADLTNVDKNIENLKQTWEERLLYFLANGTDVVWNNWLPKVNGSGETITLNNTIEAKMDIVYKGNTRQKITTGKNLFNSIYYKNKEIYTETISISTGNLYCTKLYLKPNTTYTISEALNNWSLDGGWIFVVADTNNQIIRFLQNRTQDYQTNPTTFTTNSEGYVYIGHRYGFTNGGADRAIAFLNTVNIQIEEGNTATSFEEYTNGASPNPDYPQEVEVVTGNNSIKVEGKNLFDSTLYTTTSRVRVVDNTNGVLELNGISGYYTQVEHEFNVIPNQNYVISYDALKLDTSVDSATIVIVMDSDNQTRIATNQNMGHQTISFTPPNNKIYIKFRVNGETNTGKVKYSNIQLEKSNQATTYEPYQSQSYPINLGNIELCKIGDYQDKIYKDNGKWYLHKQINKRIFNGTENWNYQSQYPRFQLTSLSPIPLNNSNLFCSHYIKGQTADTDYVCSLASGTGYSQLLVHDERFSTKEAYKTWLSSNNVSLYYVLATPTTTEITDTTLISQLEAIKKSYNTQTNISQTNASKPFILDVTALGN